MNGTHEALAARARLIPVAALCGLALAVAALAASPSDAATPGSAEIRADAERVAAGAECSFFPISLPAVRAPFQVDENAAYDIFPFKLDHDAVYTIHAQFPQSRFMNAIMYDENGKPVPGGGTDYNFIPDAGSSNPFTAGQSPFVEPRDYTITLVDDAAAYKAAHPDATNVIGLPPQSGDTNEDGAWVSFVIRVYKSFTHRPIGGPEPDVSAVDSNGDPVNCQSVRGIVREAALFLIGTATRPAPVAPAPKQDQILFSRIPVAVTPLPDVQDPSNFKSTSCAGYGIAALPDNTSFGLVHTDRFPKFWDTSDLGPSTVFPPVPPDPDAPQTRYWSIESNGQAIVGPGGNIYDEQAKETLVKKGLTILVYPNRTGVKLTKKIKAFAADEGYATLRQSRTGKPKTPYYRGNLLTMRNKAPQDAGVWKGNMSNVPCWSEDENKNGENKDPDKWYKAGMKYMLQKKYQGKYSIQGVICGHQFSDVKSGTCRKTYNKTYPSTIPKAP
jgi:hypothetical protein